MKSTPEMCIRDSRMNSEPENYAALTEEYKDAEEKLAKLYERWDAIAEDMKRRIT